LTSGKSSVITPLSSNLIAGYALINDYRNKPDLIMRIESPRPIYSQALRSIFFFDLALLAIGLIFGTLTLLFLQRSILRPIKRLSESVVTAANTKNFSTRIPVRGKDELSKVAESIDKIFDELEASAQLRHELEQLQQLEASQAKPEPIISASEQTQNPADRPTQPGPPPPPPSVDNWSDGGKV
jgi:HAMP domain-containing protein